MKRYTFLLILSLAACVCWPPVRHTLAAERQVLTDRMHHLRSGDDREWDSFPSQAESERLELAFSASANDRPAALLVRQQDVKQNWQITLNDQKLGRLTIDENDMLLCFEIPTGTLVDGDNRLVVAPAGKHGASDDIRVGDIVLDTRTREQVLGESTLDVQVADRDSRQPLPCRITIVNESGALQSLAAESDEQLAVRPGLAYTSTGRATLRLPAGAYTVYAGRGFEYSLAEVKVNVQPGEHKQVSLSIRREVDTAGWIACDTHIHTLTHSGHGDATVQERMITLAGEGIELAIAADHNVQIDHEPFAREMNVRRYFTPVIGNEVTTKTGHFNIFPVDAAAAVPDHKSDDWQTTLQNIFATPGVKVAILNHARDLHGGTTPFGPLHFNEAAGEMLDDWPVGFNAMEVVNSGATQTDPLRLLHDWMALLNRGRTITPVGSSDSHDVARHFVGQGRTYIRGDDQDPGRIDVARAVESFLQGRVIVSYGLLTEVQLGDRFGSRQLASLKDVVVAEGQLAVNIRVRGPHWVTADRVQLFASGVLVQERDVSGVNRSALSSGVIYEETWHIPAPKQDAHLVAIASGPGIEGLYWRTAKPYQPDSTFDRTQTIGCSGAVWLDVDGDGRRSSAFDYAARIVQTAEGDVERVFEALTAYDQAVATEAALVLDQAGYSPLKLVDHKSFESAEPHVQAGFNAYLQAWRKNQLARSSRP